MNYKSAVVLCVFLFSAFLMAGEEVEFTEVNVVMETEWTEPEQVNNVDVIVLTLTDGSRQIVLFRKHQKIMEITVIDGVTVKIYDAASGQLLKTYSMEPISALD